ncbi:MAG: hypothetical protein GX825_09190 [Syntrophomonadaceae bacterium]|nr:hypothetical protein [Syntrophomonadaceae bacterium]
MIIGLKLLVIIAWLAMILLLVFAPAGTKSHEHQVISSLSEWGTDPEWEINRILRGLPRPAQLLIVDDVGDRRRTQILERLLLHHSGVVGVWLTWDQSGLQEPY